MTVPTNSFISIDATGNRESLHDLISILDKDETPLQSMIGSGSAEATYEEWQIDDIGSANESNSNLEADDTTAAAITATSRVGNRTQIMKRAFTISNTQEAVKKAGRDSEINYQAMLFGRRVKIDLEATLTKNQASVAQSGATTRKFGGMPSWYTTSVSRGSGGSSGGFSSGNTVAATNGTQRVFTEDLLKAVVKTAWDAGGNPTKLLMGSFNKQKFSGFTGIATQYQNMNGKAATVVGAVDRYVSDFGKFDAIASRYCAARDVHVIDPSLWRILWLRKWKKEELAKTGDARKFHIIGEMTLESRNEAGSGIVADLTTS